jgi:hypothetical protein
MCNCTGPVVACVEERVILSASLAHVVDNVFRCGFRFRRLIIFTTVIGVLFEAAWGFSWYVLLKNGDALTILTRLLLTV